MFVVSLVDVTKVDNKLQTTSVVPRDTLLRNIVYGYFCFKLLLKNYPNDCKVSRITTSGLSNTEHWITNVTYINTTCQVEYSCTNCSLQGASHSLFFEFEQPFAMASELTYVVTAPHFRGNQFNLQAQDGITPEDSLHVFRGPKTTEFSLSFTTTQYSQIHGFDFFFYNLISKLFKIDWWNTVTLGYSISRNAIIHGSTCTEAQFWDQANRVSVLFKLNSNPNAYSVQQLGKYTILDFVGKIAALTSAVLALLAAIMGVMEKVWSLVRAKKQVLETQ